MNKLFAAALAAAFSLSVVGAAVAAPVQISQSHSQATKIQTPSDSSMTKKAKKKKVAKKTAKKKQTAKKQSV